MVTTRGRRMTNEEVAKRTGMSKHHVEQLVHTALGKISKAGQAETFAHVVHLTALEKSKAASIRCGSIECRPDIWPFFGVPTR